ARIRKSRKLPIQVGFNGVELFRGFAPLAPFFEGHPKKSAVGIPDATEQAEPRNRSEVLDAWRLVQNLLDLLANCVRALHRSGESKLNLDEEIALLFLGQESARQLLAKAAGRKV